jgi:arylsulfatase A-like enzyme
MDKSAEFRPWAMCEYRYSGFVTDPLIMTTMLRHGDWKLIVWHGEPACGTKRDGELYNMADDPNELHNLFHDPEYASQRRKMKRHMIDAMADAEDRTHPQTRAW